MLLRLVIAALSSLLLLGPLTPAAAAADEPVAELEVTAFRSPAGVSVHWSVVSSSHGWTGAVVRRHTGSETTVFVVENRRSVADPGAPVGATYTVALVTTAGETPPSASVIPTPSTDGVYFGTTPPDGSGYGLYSVPIHGAPHGVRIDLTAAGLPALDVFTSPTGDRLVTRHRTGGNHHLYVRNADGSDVPRLLASFSQQVQPAWSPDGTRLAVLLFPGAQDRLVQLGLVPLDGSGATIIEDRELESGWPLSGIVQRPAWWPDGRSLVVGDSTGRLFRVAAEPGARTLQTLPIKASQPTVSPDGDWIGYYDGVSAAVSRFDGSGLVRIGSPTAHGLVWSPDGRSVVGYHAGMGSATVITRSTDGTWGSPVAIGASSDADGADTSPRVMSWFGGAVGIGPAPAGTTRVRIDTTNLPAGTTVACAVDGVPAPCTSDWDLTGLVEGPRRLRVVATEPSGRTTVATRDIVVSGTRERDHDADGHNDLIALNARDGGLYLYRGNGAGGFLPREVIGMNLFLSEQDLLVAPGDWDGDGDQDLLSRRAGTLYLLPNDGTGWREAPIAYGTGWNAMTAVVGPGDWNGDGTNDLLARDTTGRLHLYRGDGRGGFLSRVSYGTGWNTMTAIIATGDMSGDGHRDVMARDSSGRLHLYPGNGRGGFKPRISYGTGWNAMTAIVGAGHWDAGFTNDLLARDTYGRLYLYPGNGKGGFGRRVAYGTGWNAMKLIAG